MAEWKNIIAVRWDTFEETKIWFRSRYGSYPESYHGTDCTLLVCQSGLYYGFADDVVAVEFKLMFG